MSTRWMTDITYSIIADDATIDNVQEQGIRTLRDRCPHIAESMLEINFTSPIPSHETNLNSQQLFVICPFCIPSGDLY